MEVAVDLLSPQLTADRLIRVVARLQSFFAATEPALDRWARAEPANATVLDWARRRRSGLLAADVRALGGELPPPPPPVFEQVGTAQAFGWLYVVEGSTLGGAIIARRITALTDPLPVELRAFSPYAEGPGPMWRAFGAALDDWAGADELRARAVGDAAVATFGALARWVAPLREEVPA